MSKTTIPAGGITDGTLTSTKLDQDGAFVFNEDSADVDFRVESNGNANMLHVDGGNDGVAIGTTGGAHTLQVYDQTAFVSGTSNVANTAPLNVRSSASTGGIGAISIGGSDNVAIYNHSANTLALQSMEDMLFHVSNTNDDKIGTKTERARITKAEGSFSVGQTGDNGSALTGGGDLGTILNGGSAIRRPAFCFKGDGMVINRSEGDNNTRDVVMFYRNGSNAGTISASNTTVTYGTFCGVHYAQLTDDSKPNILVGTVLESIDETCEWHQAKFTIPAKGDRPERIRKEYVEKTNNVGDVITYDFEDTDGITTSYSATIIKESDEEYLARVKVSDTENSKAVYGVFESWMESETNDMQVASLGAFMIRVHKDETVAIGDYLQSKGDGTAKVQADDILRASTIAKVVKTNKIKTYDDGSYLVSCTLHCG
jgi:hypothetical protein